MFTGHWVAFVRPLATWFCGGEVRWPPGCSGSWAGVLLLNPTIMLSWAGVLKHDNIVLSWGLKHDNVVLGWGLKHDNVGLASPSSVRGCFIIFVSS